MLFTNRYGLPDPLVRAVTWQDSSHNPDSDISCTTLIGSPLHLWLLKRYGDVVVEDVSDRLWALYGTIAHSILERFGGEGEHVEKTAIAEVKGWRVSAQVDYMKEGGCLTDYKFTSVWSVAEGVKDEWAAQVNVGLWLMRHGLDAKLREIGASVQSLAVCCMFRDWVPRMAEEFPSKVMVIPVKMWSDEKAKAFIEERASLHQSAQKEDAIPPICSDHERWMRDFAIMKHGQKNAVKAKIKTREEAEAIMADMGVAGLSIREAVPKRCMEYCVFSKNGVCPWWDSFAKQARSEPVMPPMPEETTANDPDQIRKDGAEV